MESNYGGDPAVNDTAQHRQQPTDRFGKMPTWLTERASPGACTLFGHLAGKYAHWSTGKDARPKTTTLAADLGVSTRTVQNWRRELEDVGALTVEARYDDDEGGRQTSNGYALRFDEPRHLRAVPDDADDPAHMSPPGETRFTPGVKQAAPLARAGWGSSERETVEQEEDPRHSLPANAGQELRSSGEDQRQRGCGWREPSPDDPDRVFDVGAYEDNPYRGGRRLAVIGLDRDQAHDVISAAFGVEGPEVRAAHAGFGDAGGIERPPLPEEPEVFEALVEVCGMEGETLTRSGQKQAGEAAFELAEVGATPDDVYARAGRYRQKYPGCSLTPATLARHWPALASPPPGGRADGYDDPAGPKPNPANLPPGVGVM